MSVDDWISWHHGYYSCNLTPILTNLAVRPWFSSLLKVVGGGSMKLRSADPDWLLHVDRWWNVLLPKLAPYSRSRGGPILMVQVNPPPYPTPYCTAPHLASANKPLVDMSGTSVSHATYVIISLLHHSGNFALCQICGLCYR
jgi:hypothetical protein